LYGLKRKKNNDMKYIDADKLIAEIERLQKRAEHYEEISLTDGERSYWSGENGVLELLATFITSFHQEHPEVDLVTEYDEQFDSDPAFKELANRNAGIAIALHFYKLGLKARKED
jgi:hypothetical protein